MNYDNLVAAFTIIAGLCGAGISVALIGRSVGWW